MQFCWQYTAIESNSDDDSGESDGIVPGNSSWVKPNAVQKAAKGRAQQGKKHNARVELPALPPALPALPPALPPTITNDTIITAANLNALPEFARALWSATFLPTLYDCLGCSPDPFVIDPDMVKTIQGVLNLVYPDSIYQIHVNDRIFAMVRRSIYLQVYLN
jgi:hypothetical protein